MDGFDAEGGGASADLYEQHIGLGQEAERRGYTYYFFIEHQNAFVTCVTSPNVYLAALARETSKLRFGPMVYQVPMYHPIRLAQDAAMVDQLSRGRLEFGLGYGPRIDEFRRWKLPFTERRAMGIEAMEIILQAWTQDSVTYDGEYWSFDEALPKPKPYQQPYPPVWLGAHSNESFDYAAKMNFHVAQNIDIDTTVAEKFAYWRNAWQAAGHAGPRPRQLLVRHVHVAETDEQARAEAEPSMLRGMRGGVKRTIAPEERTSILEELVRVYEETTDSYDFWIDNGLALVGSPDTVIKLLQKQQALVGYDVFVGQHHFTGMPRPLVEKSLRLFGQEVIPAFSGTPVSNP